MSLVALVAFSPRPSPKPQSAYQREIAPHEKKLVWYRFNDKLPEVSPPKQAAIPRRPRALFKHPAQTIVAKSTRPDPAKQMILAPGPELKIDQELKAPNLMAFEAPKPPEPPAPPKLFMPPRKRRGPWSSRFSRRVLLCPPRTRIRSTRFPRRGRLFKHSCRRRKPPGESIRRNCSRAR
jgi:hypothetical protein